MDVKPFQHILHHSAVFKLYTFSVLLFVLNEIKILFTVTLLIKQIAYLSEHFSAGCFGFFFFLFNSFSTWSLSCYIYS